MMFRLSATQAAKTASEVTHDVYRLFGTSGMFRDHPVAHRLQDALIVPQHAFLADGTWQSAGKVILGATTLPGYI
jgi:alkylation response protein AidB-like acyl-CoA dehydrogenase